MPDNFGRSEREYPASGTRSEAGGPVSAVTSQSDRRRDGASELQDEDQGADDGGKMEESETEDEDREGEKRYWNLRQVEDEVVRKVSK